mgnify:CR=1 FL=1
MVVYFHLFMRFIILSMICLLSLKVIGQDRQVKIHWNNGDVLPGRILPSQNSDLQFSSEIFQDNLIISASELDFLEFESIQENSDLDFLIVTTTGDVIKANLTEANDEFFTFSSKRLGRIQIKRDSVYSLSRLNNPNIIFDGSQFNEWGLDSQEAINNLVVNNDLSWQKGEGGHPFSNTNKSVLSTTIEIPEQFNLDLEISSKFAPRFLFAIGEGDRIAESDGALKLETWDDEIVLVQGQIFETVATIKGGQKNVRLRLSYNSDSRKLQIFNTNGNLLVKAEGVHIPVQSQANVSIRNRGENLNIKSMVFYKGAKRVGQEIVDDKKPRVLMDDGNMYYGQLFVSNQSAYVEREDMVVQDVDLSEVDRIFNPDSQLSDSPYSSELIYKDDIIIRGEIIQLNRNQVKLQTRFSNLPVDCLLSGASYLKFNSGQTKSGDNARSRIESKSGSDFDKMTYPEGKLRGVITFNSDSSLLAWSPEGSKSALKLSGIGSVCVERHPNRLSNFLPFDKGGYPHLLYLRHGEIIPSSVSFYGKDVVEFQMPFDRSIKKINKLLVKAIEFNPIRTLRSKASNGTELFGKWVNWRYLSNTRLGVQEDLIGWTNIDYDHSKFKVGLTGIGYGDRGVLTEVPKGTTAVFMRQVFELKEEFQSDSLYLLIDYDDGFAAYLNGKRIAETNAPPGNLNQYSMAKGSHESGELEQFDISEYINLLRKGTNVFAIVGLNNSKTSSDLLINPILSTDPLVEKKKNGSKEQVIDSKRTKKINGSEANSVKLNRALIVSRLGRENPPTHLLLARNNDIGQGKLLSINNKSVEFELTSESFSVPIERLDKVVSIEHSDGLDSRILNYDFNSQARLFLVDGSILDFVVKKSDNDFLFGESKIYGELAIPITSIQKINLGGFESDVFETKFGEWIIRSAKESDVGETSNPLPQAVSENQPLQPRSEPTPKSLVEEKVPDLIIPEKLTDKVKRVQESIYRVGEVTIDAKLRVAVFPAKVNQIIGLIEYALVTEQGKTHESFLSTKIKPGDLHLALLLLGASPKNNVSVEISWQNDGRWVRKSIVDCIAQYPLEVASEVTDKETKKSFKLKPSSWQWTGSKLRPNGILTADEQGSILSLQPDPDALSLIEPMIDTSVFGSHVWSKEVPKKDSIVQIFIQPIELQNNENSD